MLKEALSMTSKGIALSGHITGKLRQVLETSLGIHAYEINDDQNGELIFNFFSETKHPVTLLICSCFLYVVINNAQTRAQMHYN